METKQFKAESQRLLELMIHSIYTHKEIFLRELISNASDAIDKLYYKSLTGGAEGLNRDDFEIKLSLDKQNRTITISDNGIGMTKDELENNLGIIAKSGSLAFKKENELKDGIDIIGQFGVGFYSAFMVSSLVTVKTKPYGGTEAYVWQSGGVDGYTIDTCEKQSHGTEIILKIKESTEEENYDEFLDQYRIQSLVKKYSNYIRYPIKMDMQRQRLKDGSKPDEGESAYESYTETVTLNSMVPLWKKNKNEITEEEYTKFYQEKFYDFTPPIAHIHTRAEGTATYNALLFIPERPPFDYYTRDYEKGLQLFSSGVMIMDKCADLLPDHFSFVKGLVDSEDLSLNISREMLQHDRQLKIIAKSIEKNIKNELSRMLKNEREKYEKFYKSFGIQLKFGVYNDYGAAKDLLSDLLLFYSSSEKKLVTLEEYADRMKEGQKYIYYACGESISRIESMPQTELLKEKGYEILYFTDNVDEFAIRMLMQYKEKPFKSVTDNDLGLDENTENEEIKKQNEENHGLFDFMKEALGGKVKEVRLSQRLKTHPVCLASGGMISLEMEKVLNTMPGEEKAKAERILEINPSHPIFETLKKLYDSDKEKLKKYSALLYDQAMLIAGMPIENPAEFSNEICALMS